MANLERGGQHSGKGRIPWPGLVLPRRKRKRESLPWRIRNRAGRGGSQLGVGGVLGSLQSIPLLGQQPSSLLTLATKQNTTDKFANLPAGRHLTHQGTKLVERGMAPLLFPMALPRFHRMDRHLHLAQQRFLPTPSALANLLSPPPLPAPPQKHRFLPRVLSFLTWEEA